MFTGIIESLGVIQKIEEEGRNRVFWVSSALSGLLKPDQSVSHDGVCLTVEDIIDSSHRVTAIAETLEKTNLDAWFTGKTVNLERCLQLNGRLDGHFVQGHVDTTATCISIRENSGSREFTFRFDPEFKGLVVEKGSISLNGISLTIFNVSNDRFTVAIIPYTLNHTNLNDLKEGDPVNIEFDMIGKYIQRQALTRNGNT